MSTGSIQVAGVVVVIGVLVALYLLGVIYCAGFAAVFPEIFPGGDSIVCGVFTP